ncbi:hypothetical protein ACMYYO_13065 [Dermacoccaceae bacterium W4C1]
MSTTKIHTTAGAVTAIAAALSLSMIGGGSARADDGADLVRARVSCDLPATTGALDRAAVRPGLDVRACGLVGTVLRSGAVGLTVPAPGNSVSVEALQADGSEASFEISVGSDGRLSFPQEAAARVTAKAAASPGACSDGAYSLKNWKVYGTYNWYIGDGGMPGALSRSNAQKAFADAINNITGSYNNCGYTDQVSAKSSYKGTTTYEADVNSNNECTARDGKSTWDAGNLKTGTVAVTCTYFTARSGPDTALESDVRYNTTDYNFTDSPARVAPTSTTCARWAPTKPGTCSAWATWAAGTAT